MSRKLNPAIFLTLDPVRDDNELLFGSGADGYVYQMEVGQTDDGDTIETRWTTGWLDGGAPEYTKQFRYLHLHFEEIGTPIAINWSVDHGRATGTMQALVSGKGIWGPPGVWGPPPLSPGVWGPHSIAQERIVLSFPQDATGQNLQVQLTVTDTAELWKLTTLSVLYRFKDSLMVQGGT